MPADALATRDRGFTLIEVLVALLLVAVMAQGAAVLGDRTVAAIHRSREQTSATIFAAQKMEQLRSLTWGFDAGFDPEPATDASTDLSREPASAGGAGLGRAGGSLDANMAGYTDFLDARGGWVGAGTSPPPAAVFVRRWRVSPLSTAPDNVVVLEVFVTTVARASRIADISRWRGAEGAWLTSLKARKGAR